MIDQDKACPHEDFDAVVEVNRLTDDEDPERAVVIGYSADVRIVCAGCGETFRFIGAPAGIDPRRPTVDVTEATLHAPIRPASSDPDFGLGLPGFAVGVRDPQETPRT